MRLGCRSIVALALCLLADCVAAVPLYAWNKPGHMISGAIAYDVLKKEDPKSLAKALTLLRQHPQYKDVIAQRLEAVPAEDRDRYLFMVAARWADDIRNEKEYTHPVWHYVDFPYVPPGSGGKGEDPGPQNVVTAIKTNLETIKGTESAADKAVALCWVMHCIGDVHQPLHTITLYTKDYPKGDRGGNLFFIKVKEDRAVTELHALWDGLFTSSEKYNTTGKIATELLARPEFARAKLKELSNTDVLKWAQVESFDIARHNAYLDGKLAGATERTGDVPVLPEDYLSNAKTIAERRMVIAGYRLADAIKTTVKP